MRDNRVRPTLGPSSANSCHHEPPASVRQKRPTLDGPADPTGDSDAVRDWLGHMAAGRIEVR